MTLNRALPLALLAATALLLPAAPVYAAVVAHTDAIAAAAPEATSTDDLLAGAEKFSKNATNVSEINLDKKLLGMVDNFSASYSGSGAGGPIAAKLSTQSADLARKLDFVAVRSYQYSSNDDYNKKDLEAFRARLDGGGWSHVVKERSPKEEEDVWMKGDEADQSSEIVVISAEPKELNFVHIKGHMSLRELAAQGTRYGVPSQVLNPGLGNKSFRPVQIDGMPTVFTFTPRTAATGKPAPAPKPAAPAPPQ